MDNLPGIDPLPEQGKKAKTNSTQKKKPPRAAPRKPKIPTAGAGDKLLLGYRIEDAAAPIGFGGSAGPAAGAGAPVWLEGEGHVITIAPTGAGKGRGALIPNLLTYEGPAIVIDPKGEACRVTARRRREMGQEVHVIDPFGVVSEESDSLNPLDAFDIPGIEPSSLAMEIAKQLSGGNMSLPDPFWDIRAHDLSAGVISAVASLHEGADRTLLKARRYLKADDTALGLSVLLNSKAGKIHRFAREEIRSFLQTEDRCRSGIHATACSYFSVIASDAAQRTITCSTIDLQAVTRGDPMTIYLVVPPSKLASHAALFRLWTASLLSAVLSREGDLPKHRTLFAIDECAQLGDFGLLPMVYTLARSYGVRVWAFFQDLAQIKRMLPEEWQTVLTNSAALQVFGVPNHLMASDLAQVLGDFSEDELRRMDRNHLALQVAGSRGITARRPDYLLDPMYQGLFDPHPMMKGRKPAPPGQGTFFG
ncbi:MAG: type IV secretory system conjugative DNA transfer family protein [Hyphomonas sp.]|uniref:type IV secretory system conjugative DNA transfer family protein n=1 Tax=Hyphomonas sp. TaxID=87 RepID=UPI00352859C6